MSPEKKTQIQYDSYLFQFLKIIWFNSLRHIQISIKYYKTRRVSLEQQTLKRSKSFFPPSFLKLDRHRKFKRISIFGFSKSASRPVGTPLKGVILCLYGRLGKLIMGNRTCFGMLPQYFNINYKIKCSGVLVKVSK